MRVHDLLLFHLQGLQYVFVFYEARVHGTLLFHLKGL